MNAQEDNAGFSENGEEKKIYPFHHQISAFSLNRKFKAFILINNALSILTIQNSLSALQKY